ncbi:MAG: PAS domain S-box protein [Phycisphaeraceae bacterium]|nr:PAS domain S-box protein [Phycisphaerales bacterium]MCB9861617.1 PAS domain S-box protein [Phycisphaeraceae bacterium]
MGSQRRTHTQRAHRHVRWHLVYLVLAAIDVSVVLGSLTLNYWLSSLYKSSVQATSTLSQRINDIADARNTTSAVNVIINDLFGHSARVPNSDSFSHEIATLRNKAGALHNALHAKIHRGNKESQQHAAAFALALDRVADALNELEVSGQRVLSIFHDNGPAAAGIAMSEFDRTTARFLRSLDALEAMCVKRIGEYQQDQLERNNIIQTVEYITAGWLLIMIIAIVSYARRLARAMTSAENDLHIAKQSADEARERLAAYQTAIDHHSIVAMTDVRGTITEVNDLFCQISGYSREELVGRNHRILNSGKHPKSFWVEAWRTFANGSTWRAEVCNRRKDGSLYWVDTSITPMFDNENSITGYCAVRTDITRNREREEALQETAMALDSATDCIFIFDAQSLKFVYINRGAQEQVGYTEDELLSMTPLDIKPDFDKESFLRHVYPLVSKRESSITFRTDHLHKDGHRIPVEVTLQLVENLGSHGRFVAIVRDISERLTFEKGLQNAREAAEHASRVKSEFLANMSHEIRTPMTSILGYTDLLTSDETYTNNPELAQEALHTIKSNVHHLLNIINDILDVSKIEVGRMTIERVAVDIGEIVENITAIVRPNAERKQLDFLVESLTPIPAQVLTDPTRVYQMLSNLLGNAVKFTDRGSVSLKISYAPHSQSDGLLTFSVEDTGIGMTPEQVESISRFHAFSQADSSTTRKFGGTGLGLRISNSLAQLLGGSLRVQSEYGVGSTFELTLPVMLANSTHEHRSAQSQLLETVEDTTSYVDQSEPLLGCRILLAEDGADNQRLVRYHLAHAGADVEIAENGQIAVDAVVQSQRASNPFDLVLMDMQMPVMDGYDATRMLRQRGYLLPIIALTAHAMSGDRKRCTDAGCSDYLTKPIDKIVLIELCSRWILQSSYQR